jgi:hypothetical protein
MHSKFELPVERRVEYEELFGTSMFYVFLITFLICLIIDASHKYNEHMLIIEINKCKKIISNINYRFDIFDNKLVSNMDTDAMIKSLDNIDYSSNTESDLASETDSDSDTSVDEEVEKASLTLMGMSRGKNWIF